MKQEYTNLGLRASITQLPDKRRLWKYPLIAVGEFQSTSPVQLRREFVDRDQRDQQAVRTAVRFRDKLG